LWQLKNQWVKARIAARIPDGFEIRCDSGQVVTATFAKDCCDHEVMAWRAWVGKGLPGEPVRDMLIEAVEKRFGAVDAIPAQHALEFLSDNGEAYIAHDTRKIARALGLDPYAGVQSREQRHRRKLRQHVPAGLRQPHGPHRRGDRASPATGGLRALQRGASPLQPENALAARVQAAKKSGVNQRIGGVRGYGARPKLL
jgi:hypothetical protein